MNFAIRMDAQPGVDAVGVVVMVPGAAGESTRFSPRTCSLTQRLREQELRLGQS